MAYYSYYQGMPSWGQTSYQFAAPPMPTYQPQPTWHGADYLQAHYGAPDNSMWDYVWSRVKNFATGGGVGREEAKYWHRRVYGGLVDIAALEPQAVGAAAGYEALRIWEYHKSVYRQPLSDDHEREREGLAGLATGEASKLWQYTGRYSDKYGRREACESAALTAERIFNHKYDYDSYEAYEQYPGGHRSRRGSFYGGSEYGGSEYGEDYDRRSLRRRHSSTSLYRPGSAAGYITPAPIGAVGAVVPANAYGTQYATGAYGTPAYGGAGYGGVGYGGTGYATPGYGAAGYGYGAAAGYGGYANAAYPTASYGGGMPPLAQSYGGYEQYPGQSSGLPMPVYGTRPRRASFGYGYQTPY